MSEENGNTEGEAAEATAEEAPAAALDELDGAAQGAGAPEDNPDLEVVLDIPVKIAMEVGSTQITIRNLLQLNQGSVIELDRLAGEPLDVLVNGTLVVEDSKVLPGVYPGEPIRRAFK